MGSKSPFNKRKKQLNSYARYSGMAIQMGGIIGGGTWLGVWLDEQTTMEFPLFTLILSLFSVFAAIYLVLKDLIQK